MGRNLIDIVFSTQQVADSDEHRLLMALQDSKLKDGEVRQEFYQAVIDSLDMGESNYLILLAHDTYDVPHRGKDGEDWADELHQEFLDAIFHTEPPMSSGEQREAFQTALREGLEGTCGLEVVQAVHERLTAKIEEHREAKDPEPLAVTARDVAAILRDCGAEEPQITTFCEKCGELFGEDAVLSPANLIDSRRFEVWAAGITVSVPPEQSYQVEARIIDGKRYLLVPAGEGLEVNGMPVDWVHTENE